MQAFSALTVHQPWLSQICCKLAVLRCLPSWRFLNHECLLGFQTLHGMLEREIWKQLPIIPGGLPSIRAALDDPSVLAAFPFDTSNFGEWVAHGNPWHMQAYGESHLLRAAAGCVDLSFDRVPYAHMRLTRKELDNQHQPLHAFWNALRNHDVLCRG